MPLYQYSALNKRGNRITATIDAPSVSEVKDRLKAQGLMPIKIILAPIGGSGFSLGRLFEKKVDTKTVILFTRQMAVLLRASVPLLQAMELLIEQFDGSFRRVLINIKDGIKGGESLAKELEKYPKIFSNVYVQLVKAGEATGKLDLILERLVSYLERTAETKKRIKKAMTYPVAMISFSLIVVFVLLTTLVPRMKQLFGQLKQELPEPTLILIAMSDFTQNNWMLIIIGVIASITLFSYWKSTKAGQYKFHEILLRLPLISYFSKTSAVVQFCETLGMLLECGVNLSGALDIVCNIVENKVLVKKLQDARDKIIKEGKIARYLKETGIFPNMANYMITTGEQSGKLGEMLTQVGKDYSRELAEITDGLTAAISPIMTLFLALIVGFIVISIFLPIISMGDMTGI
jgi:type II secretory pathway component PulF